MYTVLASYSGTGKNNWHIIHSIKFNDMEETIKSESKHDKFTKKGVDVLEIGNKDSKLLKNEKDLILAYNR